MKRFLLNAFDRLKKPSYQRDERRYQFLLKDAPIQKYRVKFSGLKSGYFTDSFNASGKLSHKISSENISIINIFTNKPENLVEFTITNCEIQINVNNLNCIKPRYNNSCIFKVVYKVDGSKPVILASFALFLQQSRPKTIFIVGSPRSGTTAVGEAVKKILGKTIHGESHIAPFFKRQQENIIKDRNKSSACKNKGTLMHDLIPIELEFEFHKMVKNIHSSFYGREYIIDKTPGLPMIEALPFLFRIYPNSKVLFCQRRGIENINSRLRKFPKLSFKTHCRQWTNAMKGWLKIKKQINKQLGQSDWFCVVEQFELLHNSKKEVNKIATFLKATERQENRAIDFLKKKSPERTSRDTSATSLENSGWNDEQKEYFIAKSSRVMKTFNYSLDEHYFLNISNSHKKS